METLAQDIRYALRGLRRSAGLTAVIVLTLALGIGANTAIFSVVRAVLLRPLAYEDAGRLVALFRVEREGSERRNPTSPANFLDMRRQAESLEHMTAATPWSPTLTGGDTPLRLSGLRATPSLFRLLGVEPSLGRAFAPEEAGGERVVVIGDALWRRQFGADPAVVGRSLTLDGEPHTVIGVMPPGFEFPPFWATGAELWVPLAFEPEQAEARSASYLRVFARLRPGVSLQAARAEMEAIGARLAARYPEANEGTGINLEPLREPVVAAARPALLALLGAVGLVLLIACANIANLLIGRAAAREREVAVRTALGAGHGRLVRQWLTEGAVLALCGGAAGYLLAVWGVDALVRLAPDSIPRLREVRPDATVLGFTLALSLLTGVGFGMVPAARAARTDLAQALRGRHRGDRGGRRLRRALVGFEIALALVLLVGATLLLRSFVRMQQVDPGFRTDAALALDVSLAGSSHEEPARQGVFFGEVLRRVEAIPGVRAAGFVNHLPIAGDTWRSRVAVEGGAPESGDPPGASFRVVTPGLLAALGTPLLRGRWLEERDTEEVPPVVLVNQALARRFWPGGDALGRRLRMGGPDSDDPWLTVVGVVGDVKQQSLTEEALPEMYLPYGQNPVAWHTSSTLVVHHVPDARGLAAAVSAAVWEVDGSVPVSGVRSMEEILSEHLRRQRLLLALFALFAGTALVLATIGVYEVISYLVGQRTHEIGVRMALGASRTHVVRMVLAEMGGMAAAALAAGTVAALLLTRFLASQLYGVGPTDPPTFVGVALLLVLVALLASYLPARRAARVDPMVALRAE